MRCCICSPYRHNAGNLQKKSCPFVKHRTANKTRIIPSPPRHSQKQNSNFYRIIIWGFTVKKRSFFVDSTTKRRVRERNSAFTAISFAQSSQTAQIYKNFLRCSKIIHKILDSFAKKLLTIRFLFDRMKLNKDVFFLSAVENTF